MLNKKFITRVICLVLALVFALSIPASAETLMSRDSTGYNDIPNTTFTVWNSGNNNGAVATKPMYDMYATLNPEDIGAQSIQAYTDVTIDNDDNVYLLDGNAAVIYVLDSNYKPLKQISNLSYEGEKLNFEGAKGIVVSDDNRLFISDTEHARVIVTDLDGKVSDIILLVDSPLIPTDFIFRPLRVAVDSNNYVYVLSDGSYYGAILYSPSGEFLGFYGANSVTSSLTQALLAIWQKLTTTNAKRSKQATKLPYTFSDLFADHDDFVYTATGSVGSYGESNSGQVKRLSPGGLNTLDNTAFFGIKANSGNDKSNIVGVVADDNDFIYCCSSDGKIFVYDNECSMLNCFGTVDKSDDGKVGAYEYLAALDITSNRDIVTIDNQRMVVYVYKLNDYGKILLEADNLQIEGEYDAALPLWEEVLKQDINNQMAYSGIAKNHLIHEEYDEAMEYAKNAFDKDTYSLAFKYVRRDFLDKYLNVIFIAALVIIGAIIFVSKYKKKHRIVWIKNNELKLLSRVIFHPNDVFKDVKEKQHGSTKIGILLIVIYYITTTMKNSLGGFLFVSSFSANLNSLITLLRTIGIVLLWTIVNWAVCTLMDGKGKIREIFVVTTYALMPLIVSNIIYVVLSNCLVSNESAFISILTTICELFTAFILISGTLIIHDFSFGKFVGTSILTIIGMLIVLFVGIVVFILIQQLFAFIVTVFREIVFR